PELLVARHGTMVTANPLAGSAARSEDPIEDGRRATMLLRSAKDRREHAAVVAAIVANLRPLCTDIRVPAEPQLLPTATMWHLARLGSGRRAGRNQRQVPHPALRAGHVMTDFVPWPPEFADRYRAAGYWRGQPLGDLIADRGEAIAVVDGERRWTYRELDERA